MNPKLRDIKIIAGALALLYGASFAFHVASFYQGELHFRTGVIAILLGVLCLASLAVIQLKEWGRTALVMGNAAMGIYLLVPYLALSDIIPLSFIFMNVAMLLFFNQESIKSYFSNKPFIAQAGGWRCILLIDDDQTLVKVIRPALISNGYSVLTAENGEEGMKVARTQKPDLILLDVILPGMKGREVCRNLKDDPITRSIPVVFLTAKNSPDDIAAEKAIGAAGHLTKPVNVKALITTVQKVLGI